MGRQNDSWFARAWTVACNALRANRRRSGTSARDSCRRRPVPHVWRRIHASHHARQANSRYGATRTVQPLGGNQLHELGAFEYFTAIGRDQIPVPVDLGTVGELADEPAFDRLHDDRCLESLATLAANSAHNREVLAALAGPAGPAGPAAGESVQGVLDREQPAIAELRSEIQAITLSHIHRA